MNFEEILYRRFGFEKFRPGQKEVISALAKGENTIGILPTGTGKSLCYQFMGNILNGQVLIVSPLLSLMQDQVEQLMAKGEKRVIALNSFLNMSQKRMALQSLRNYKYIFISPEMLQVSSILIKLKELKLALFVVDEAHCISQWGYDFRTDYQKLGDIRIKLGSPLTLALTATATKVVIKDITQILNIAGATIFETSVDRPNISLQIEKFEDVRSKNQAVITYLKRIPGPGIIYFSSKRIAEQTVEFLKMNGISNVMAYHGGMTHEDRILIQQQFIYGQIDYICATSAFGMGINKEDIRFVIHFHMPLQLESYLQEIGRAGRDGKQSLAILLYLNGDEGLALQLAEGELPAHDQLHWLMDQLASEEDRIPSILTEKLRLLGGFTENQWRVTKDYIISHFEKGQPFIQIMNDFKQFVTTRRNYKVKKVLELVNLIKTPDCRRNTILTYFGEQPSTKIIPNCCDHCGIQMDIFQNEIKRENNDSKKHDWIWRLTKLLTPTENERIRE